MRIEHLHYLLVIDRYHSISAAARELFISQTALSSILSKMEEELGFRIFERVHDGVVPTEEGKEALSLAWDIWSRWQNTLFSTDESEQRPLPVNIMTSPSVACGLTQPITHMFYERVPRGQLFFHKVLGSTVGTRIVQSSANIGLTYFSKAGLEEFLPVAQKYQVQVTPVHTDHLFLVARRDNPIREVGCVDLLSLKNQRFAIPPFFLFAASSQIFYSQLVDSSNRFTAFDSIPLIKEAVLRWNVLGIMSGFAAKCDKSVDNSQLALIPFSGIEGENLMELYLIHQRPSNLHRQERAMIDCIQEFFASIRSQDSMDLNGSIEL